MSATDRSIRYRPRSVTIGCVPSSAMTTDRSSEIVWSTTAPGLRGNRSPHRSSIRRSFDTERPAALTRSSHTCLALRLGKSDTPTRRVAVRTSIGPNRQNRTVELSILSS